MVLDLFSYYIERNNTDGVLNYIINGTDVEDELANGYRPAEWALKCRSDASYELLIDFGADPAVRSTGSQYDT